MGRREYTISIYPEVYQAFKLLCDRSRYKRLNLAVERIMLKCIDEGALPIPAQGSKEVELIRRVDLLKKRLEFRRRLGWKRSN